MTPTPALPPYLVLFDAVCGFCDRTIQRLLELDRQQRLSFAPLQGPTAAGVRQRHPELPDDLDSVIFVDSTAGERVYSRSAAAFAIADVIGNRSLLFRLARRLPRFITDLGYRAVAATRYRLFGKLDQCRIPKPEERQRFLP